MVVWLPHGREAFACSENEIDADAEVDLQSLAADIRNVALTLFKQLMFGAGWRSVFQVSEAQLIAGALDVLMVKERFLHLD